jgi:hypothetical protein
MTNCFFLNLFFNIMTPLCKFSWLRLYDDDDDDDDDDDYDDDDDDDKSTTM